MAYRALLAAPSPLYIPVFHAWATAGRTFRKDIRLAYAKDSDDRRDYLIEESLGHKSPRDVLFAVGDLTRLNKHFVDRKNLIHPIILRGLIDRMCLWLLDSDNFAEGLSTPEADGNHLVLCHPKHMTTYHVASYYMKTHGGWSDAHVERRLYPVKPGEESLYYRKWLGKKGHDQKLAYMSTQLPLSDSDHKIVEHFNELFSDVSMTGIFSSAEIWQKKGALARDFLDRIGNSINILYTEGDQVAWDLHENRQSLRAVNFHFSYNQIRAQCEYLVRINGYSTNLALKEEQLRKMVDIRGAVEDIDRDGLMGHLKSLFASDLPQTEVDPVARQDLLAEALDTRSDARKLIAEGEDEQPIEFSKAGFLVAICRAVYVTVAIAVAAREVKFVFFQPSNMTPQNWSAGEILFVIIAMIGVISVDGWKAIHLKHMSASAALAFITALLCLGLAVAHKLDRPGLAAVAISFVGVWLTFMGTWIAQTRWTPRFRPVVDWPVRVIRGLRAAWAFEEAAARARGQ